MNGLLLEGHAPFNAINRLLISFQMFESAYSAPLGRLPLPGPGEAEKGAHTVAAGFGWSDAGESLRFQNSWGRSWGDGGYGWLSREYLDRYMIDAWLSRNARVGPSRFTFARLMEASGAKNFARAWMLENPRLRARFRHGGRSHRLQYYETLSHTGGPLAVLEIRDGRGRLLGWAHLYFPRGRPRTSVLKELFVWPSFRRQGYGGILEEWATERARHWDSERIEILFHEVDALPRNRAAGSAFLRKVGYELKWRRHSRPNLAAIGEKVL
jgi:GNAT superfamily N-acetyltransferase